VTPRARRLAHERGIDLDSLPLDGTITGDDVLGLATKPADRHEPVAAPPARVVDAHRDGESMRIAIASLMERSWTSIPHYHVAASIDVTDVEDRLTATNLEHPPSERLLLGALLNAAIARAAGDVPDCNGWWRSGTFVPAESVDLGIVVSLRSGGIVVPTIVAADRLSPEEMMARMRELVERARRGRLRGSDLGDASITVTSLGDVGAESVAGVIHPPQVTLVGLGSVREEAVVAGGEICARRIIHATVAGDHRAHDGLRGARLLERVRHHLEDLP
jgi:pyruvate dehydrogenase E2 component (dihydrolipoamide acetyltransferase)